MSLEGLQLGRYRLRQMLGRGGMGEVYLAEDVRINQQVAIKISQSEASPYPNTEVAQEAARLFQREARAIAMLDHPNILSLFDFGEETVNEVTLTYIVMPFRKEGSLATWLRQRSSVGLLTPEEVANIVRQAANALQHAHNHQIIHQDVKPSNFLIRANPENPNLPDLLLADFGIAKLMSTTSSVSQTSRGTPTYMAPEQWLGQPVPATDQYALAIMAYELLAGHLPFQGRQEQVMYQHLQAQPQPPSTLNPRIPEDIDAVLLKALAKRPEERFLNISAFANAFQQASQPALSTVTGPSTPQSGSDIRTTLAISSTEARYGTNRVLTLPDGRQIGITVPAGISHGQILRLEGRGELSLYGGPAGALILTIAITPAEAIATDSPSQREVTFLKSGSQPNLYRTAEMTPFPSRPSMPGGAQVITTRRKASSKVAAMLLIVLAVLLVAGSSGIFYYITQSKGKTTTGSHTSVTSITPSVHPTQPARPKAPANQQVFVNPLPVADLATFDPALSTDLYSIQAIQAVFTGLVELDDNLNVYGELAQSWQESSDGLSWTFHLRSNLKFSDGTPLTSKDVAYSIDRALQPAVRSGTSPIYLALILDSDKLNAGKISTIINDSLLTPDDNTIIIKTNRNAAYFLDTLTYPCSYVVEKSLIDRYGNTSFTDHLTEGGGEGPWKVQEYNHSTGITLVPNQYYHGSKPQMQKLVLPFYRDLDTEYNAYLAGQISMTNVPAAHLTEAQAKTLEYQKILLLEIFYFTMNYLVKPFDNIHIRQAFALAINKDTLESAIFRNASIATNHIVPQGMPGYNPNLTGPSGATGTAGDATKARQLFQMGLQEEGWSSVSQMPPIKLTYNRGSKTTENLIAAAIQMWQNVLGVSVKPDPVDFNKLLDEMAASTNNPQGLQMWRIGWAADYPDPQDWLTLQFDKGSPQNNMNYGQNNSADAAQQRATQTLMEQADANPDQNARLQQYNQAEQQLVDDVAWLPITQGADNLLLKPCVQGLVFNADEIIPPGDWANVYISTDTPCANATV